MGNQRNRGKIPPRYRHRIDEYRSLWSRWNGIKRRCTNENDERYHQYGGRGIKVCDAWLESFDNFADWALAHGYADTLTLERIDVNGDYCPENCKWISLQEQSLNKRGTKWVDYQGEHIQLIVLCDRMGLSYDTVHDRIYKRGWSVEDALTKPSQRTNSLMSKCRERGIKYSIVLDRIHKLGWSEERALNTPSVGRGANSKTYQ